ncbi:AAA family ATPase [Massilia timonae]|uniref:Putative peptidoglycan binding domain protein n=1 Tax=Massilia timonae TaxID=47229 RepID=A0A1S2NH19_9BURK|nr:AAA family ATPase [Massilia timonae]OIJ44239.1 putative peptidoglycan binding domain protein [Massilia timonae]
MYNHYFQLKHAPFSIAPDPRYLFMSERHREALAHLLYGIGSGGGFVLLTGEIGAGKTTVCRCFIEQVPDNCRLAYIFNPRLNAEELLQTICDELHIALPSGVSGVKSYVDAINRYLLESHAQGLNNVLVIDEAQNLSSEVLEQLRLLTNLETSERKLLQIILIGQPELRTMLARPELEQLAQRVIARYHLGPLSEQETGAYIAHRLAVSGAAGMPFPPGLTPVVHRLTHGVPRRINLLCDRALLGAYVENSPHVTRAILLKSAEEVFAGEPASRKPRRWPLLAGGALAGVAISAAAWQMLPHQQQAQPASAQAAPAVVTQVAARPSPASIQAAPVAGADFAAGKSENDALRALAALWGPSFAGIAGSSPKATCEAAQRANLRCHQGRGGLYELRLLDRPAVVTLHDGPRTGYAVLVGMDQDSVLLAVGGRRQRVTIPAFVARFGGEFTTFWRMPGAFRDVVGQGDRGPDVDWIAQRLAGLNKTTAPALDQPLAARTQEWLRAFQAAQDLKADGVAGPRTYMRLNQLSGVAEPRLMAGPVTGN